MATYVLIHGAGDVAWCWHLLAAELRERGHDVVAMDLPCDDESAGLSEYADTVVEAIGDRTDLVVVAQSFAGFTAPLVCDRVPVDLLVLVAGMVPSPGESAAEMFANTGYEQAARESDAHDDSEIAVFYHDVPPDLAAEALSRERAQAETPGTGAVAARGVAGRADQVPAVPRGPASSRPSGCGGSCASAWASPPTRSTAATAPS